MPSEGSIAVGVIWFQISWSAITVIQYITGARGYFSVCAVPAHIGFANTATTEYNESEKRLELVPEQPFHTVTHPDCCSDDAWIRSADYRYAVLDVLRCSQRRTNFNPRPSMELPVRSLA
jgi:hypothetical protein